MKLKSPTENSVQVALLSGHCIVIGPDGRDVPQEFMAEALRCGCLPVEMSAEDIKPADPVPAGNERIDQISAVVKQMLGDGCELTGAGLPHLKEVSKASGFTVTAVELAAVMAELEKAAQ